MEVGLGRGGAGAGPYRALVAAPGAWGCWWSLGVSAPSSCVGCSPAAFTAGVAASRAPSAAACGRASSPLPVRMPLQTHRSLRAAFQKVYAAVRRTYEAGLLNYYSEFVRMLAAAQGSSS
jgi:hypothetical protein